MHNSYVTNFKEWLQMKESVVIKKLNKKNIKFSELIKKLQDVLSQTLNQNAFAYRYYIYRV